ncbi:alpha/beta hydrolase [Novosphingobium sp. 1949]|uniref:Alpha/beta hydrolase n=1 Tax=Novosphingobium organovorum TaxID=2930092 RepID=A0ABT0BDE7_9SPHN|nr:alpha/beta hydrolase [Novosphingobium organovorum]MCJ2182819.1 alpha/beta hydrolase [Novosphingobium organovorum]
MSLTPFPSRRTLLGGLALAGLAATTARPALAGSTALSYSGPSIPLWPGSPPGAPATLPSFASAQKSKDTAFDDRWFTGIAAPTLEVRKPAYRDGSSVILLPGGGYGFLAWDNEGEEQARWLTARGVTCFILKYRLPGEGWARRGLVPLQDAQRGVRLVRAHAKDFGLDPARVAVLGFSAGGHLGGSIATRFAEKVYDPVDASDALSARPDLAGLIYPVVTLTQPYVHAGSRDNLLGANASAAAIAQGSVEQRVDQNTPPVFVTAASDDTTVPIQNSVALYNAMLAAGRPVEFHGFDKGGHGFGVRLPDDTPAHVWPELFHAFGARHAIFGGSSG